MSQAIPKTVKQWVVTGTNGFDSLKFSEQQVPALGDGQVLVKIQGASLNYRDLTIPKAQYPFPAVDNVIPGSDGAGTVLAVGKNVQRFKPGDKVVTLFNQTHIGGSLDNLSIHSGLGGAIHGTFRTVGAFDEHGLVPMPKNLSFIEAATLTCAGLTAWNALYGAQQLLPGQWVLTQGTGGVSIFALQFAKAAGAKVISTTSSPEKAKLLEKLGADHIINYKETPQWGVKAKELTGGVGVDQVLEVSGPTSMKQSLESIKIDGLISIIGWVGGQTTKDQPGFLEALNRICTTRGILVGSRVQMEDMCRAVEAHPKTLKPVVDKVFTLEQLREAYEYQWSGKHQGKVCVKIE